MVRRTAVVCGILLWLASASTASAQQSASQLSRAAKKLYKQKKYDKAAETLHKAIELDPNNAGAHFQLACTLGMLRKQGKICEHRAFRSTILRHLVRAKLSRREKRRIRRNAALQPVLDTVGYYRLMGLSVRKTADVETILRKVSWYGAPGPDGKPASKLRFMPKGKLELEIGSGAERATHTGSYFVRSNLVEVKLAKPVGDVGTLQGALKETGELVLPGLPGPFTDGSHDAHLCD
ncbi:MAG: tetratricopeptide repeat protein [Deltaproteobacteria bacterium]|nr:tetratricopeptide repeat protein [Deltaproteobacteria bacterium]